MSKNSRTSQDDLRPDPTERNVDGGLTELFQSDRAVAQPVAGTLICEGDESGNSDLEIQQGTDVLCADGEKIGEVVDVIGNHLVVERGFFIPSDIYVPRDAISGHDDAGLYLNLTKRQVESRDWSEEPGEDASG